MNASQGPRLHFIANGVFSTRIAGGDIHFLKLAEGAARAGRTLHFFGGHALRDVLQEHRIPGDITLTDAAPMARVDGGTLAGQVALFRDMYARYRRTLAQLRRIREHDTVYAVSDYWFDVVPAVRAPARRKLMVLHMDAPRLGQVVRRSRPDVDPARMASFHYWASQEYSLRRFAHCSDKHLLLLHPHMRPRLRRLGVEDRDMTQVSYGLDTAVADTVSDPARELDVVWIGRVHRQKGIEDLLNTMRHLAGRFPGFRAVIIGNVEEALRDQVDRAGLTAAVRFSGFVSESEKLRLFKSSRLFLMPSKHEGSPRVIGESILCRTPVVAYDIPNYRPIFGDLVNYALAFDRGAFQAEASRVLEAMRGGRPGLNDWDLTSFKQENDWSTVQARFLQALTPSCPDEPGSP
jgi:glycosyltransferase involved in cell wall biosynthesis